MIKQTRKFVSNIAAVDKKLDEVKRIGLGSGMFCELPARQYVNDYLIPNFYFHIATAYAILRNVGVPLGKADYMNFLVPHVKTESGA